MQTRYLGRSGLQVSALSLGTMTFGGVGNFATMGDIQADGARRLVDIALEAGVTLFDTADVYSRGASEEILGKAVTGRRDEVLLATKVYGRMGEGPNDAGLSRAHIVRACEDSLRRLGTDWIDLYQVHGWDGYTPVEETLGALDDLVRSGKVRYVGCSNFSGWHLMKSLAASERERLTRYASQQVYYSLISRELEFELVPLTLDQGVGVLVWSPLAGGLLSGKFRRGAEGPEGARGSAGIGVPEGVDEERLYDIVEVLDETASAHDASVAQVALAWLLRKPGVSTVIVGARDEDQLRANLAAASLELSGDEVARLDEASAPSLIYPYWHQQTYGERVPPIGRA
jgi:aryl-alcohol dehydrogenase-like predicted oxidoreductase